MENKRIAEILYNLSCDLDYMDYASNLEDELNDITSALEHLQGLAAYNDDLKLLVDLIEQIASVNEYIRDIVNEIRNIND